MSLLQTLTGTAALLACLAAAAQSRDGVVLIGHPSMPRIDVSTAQRLYTGRALEVNGAAVTVVNAVPQAKARERFMASVMNQDDDKYVAYWTVRKHIGKGTPPREFKTAAEMIEYVQSTPGAIGYVIEADLRPGLNIVLKP